MAYRSNRTDPGQSGSGLHGMLPCPVACLGCDELGRGKYAMGQPKPDAAPDKAANLSPRHPRSRKFGRSHHSR
jgi:hypothetical protein